ncbi:AraC family transcriptional regulator ligand-binding domain-containing protein, partial [Acinetobacter baumannii]
LAAGDTPVMPVRAWREVLEAAAGRLRQPDLGLRLGQRFTPAHLGLLGYVLQSCGTVGAALERLQHYERLINGINRLRRREVTDDSGLPCTDLI